MEVKPISVLQKLCFGRNLGRWLKSHKWGATQDFLEVYLYQILDFRQIIERWFLHLPSSAQFFLLDNITHTLQKETFAPSSEYSPWQRHQLSALLLVMPLPQALGSRTRESDSCEPAKDPLFVLKIWIVKRIVIPSSSWVSRSWRLTVSSWSPRTIMNGNANARTGFTGNIGGMPFDSVGPPKSAALVAGDKKGKNGWSDAKFCNQIGVRLLPFSNIGAGCRTGYMSNRTN